MNDQIMPVSDTDEAGSRITLAILTAMSKNTVSQRSLANELGIALGLTNAYVRRCVRKGLLKVRRVPPNRYTYFVTPKGFAEKSRLTARYLRNSFQFYRAARGDIHACLATCAERGYRRLALGGAGELAEITVIVAMQHPIELAAVIDARAKGERFLTLPLVRSPAAVEDLDAIVVTDLLRPTETFRNLSRELDERRIFLPSLLMVSRETNLEPGKT